MKIIVKRRWQQTTNKIALRVSCLLNDGQPNPDWVVARMREEFPQASECQILTAVASETHNLTAVFLRANAPNINHSAASAEDGWSDTQHTRNSCEYIDTYWPVLRLVRSMYYEEQMSRNYGDYADNAAQKVMQMWASTFDSGPSGREKLQDAQAAVIRHTPVRVETVIMASKILFCSNQEDKDFFNYLREGLPHISYRYELNETETLHLLDDWNNFVAEQVC